MKTIVVKCRYGAIQVFADDRFISKSLLELGEYSEREVDLWRHILRPEMIAVEVGANIGALTLPLAGIVSHVYAIEPQPQINDLLLENTKHLPNVTVMNMAIGSTRGIMYAPSLDHLSDTNYGAIEMGSDGDCQVPVVPLDTLPLGERVDFIKIDVEGMEADVLKGAREIINRCRPLLYVENDRPGFDSLIGTVRALGYRCWWHLPPLFSSNNFRGSTKNPFGELVSMNMLCIPTERVPEFAKVTADLRPAVPASVGRKGWVGVARFGGIGDDLIAASVLAPLKRQGYKIDIITQMPQGVVFENNPYVDKLSIKEPGEIPNTDQMAWQNWFKTRAGEYDKFVNLSHSCEVSLAILAAMTQAQWLPSARRKYFGHNYLEFVHDLLEVPYEFGPLFFPTEEERDQAAHTRRRIGTGPIIGWCLNGSRVDKVYAALPIAIARVIKELGAQVVMFGAPPPRPDFAAAKQCQEHVINQNGTDRGLQLALSPNDVDNSWPIRRMLTQVLDCDVVVGPDTGPMWAAAFEQMPKIMLHSHASQNNITKHWRNTISLIPDQREVPCWPCHLLHDDVGSCQREQRRCGLKPDTNDKAAACISSISVETIVGAIRSVLTNREKSSV